ncbi:hypothetical protein NQ314_004163 [Rhamnusium bicolor]|uniref:Uncharacterized protein n=1 Tax=Rhamnusium bicolor TaxID=1586634 RepID=A0AAV8ZK64_9CUCU|nr:hypothetical protein NQ314_004163 [Rhamnusium bicolor]
MTSSSHIEKANFKFTDVRIIMSGSSLYLLRKLPKNSISQISNVIRNYSRKVNSSDGSYKQVKPRKSIQVLLGITSCELIGDSSHGSMLCRVQTCPTVLRKTVSELFPYRIVEDNSELSVITITLKPNIKRMRTNKELETEKMAQTFLIAAKNICDKLRNSGYWADFINPFSGLPYFTPSSLSELYETDEKFRCLDFQIFEIKDCKVIANEDRSQKRFIGVLKFADEGYQRNNTDELKNLSKLSTMMVDA